MGTLFLGKNVALELLMGFFNTVEGEDIHLIYFKTFANKIKTVYVTEYLLGLCKVRNVCMPFRSGLELLFLKQIHLKSHSLNLHCFSKPLILHLPMNTTFLNLCLHFFVLSLSVFMVHAAMPDSGFVVVPRGYFGYLVACLVHRD